MENRAEALVAGVSSTVSVCRRGAGGGVGQTTRIQKGHPKHSNINKMKRQRNTQQVKEQDKCPSKQTNSKINNIKRQRNTQQVKEQDKCPPIQTKRKR